MNLPTFTLTPAIEWLESEEGRLSFAAEEAVRVRPMFQLICDDGSDCGASDCDTCFHRPFTPPMKINGHDYANPMRWLL